MDDEEVRDLIGAIYEAASAPEQWGAIVRKIKMATRSHFGMLWFGIQTPLLKSLRSIKVTFSPSSTQNFSLSDFEGFCTRQSGPLSDGTIRANCTSRSVGSGSYRPRTCSDR